MRNKRLTRKNDAHRHNYTNNSIPLLKICTENNIKKINKNIHFFNVSLPCSMKVDYEEGLIVVQLQSKFSNPSS